MFPLDTRRFSNSYVLRAVCGPVVAQRDGVQRDGESRVIRLRRSGETNTETLFISGKASRLPARWRWAMPRRGSGPDGPRWCGSDTLRLTCRAERPRTRGCASCTVESKVLDHPDIRVAAQASDGQASPVGRGYSGNLGINYAERLLPYRLRLAVEIHVE